MEYVVGCLLRGCARKSCGCPGVNHVPPRGVCVCARSHQAFILWLFPLGPGQGREECQSVRGPIPTSDLTLAHCQDILWGAWASGSPRIQRILRVFVLSWWWGKELGGYGRETVWAVFADAWETTSLRRQPHPFDGTVAGGARVRCVPARAYQVLLPVCVCAVVAKELTTAEADKHV